MMRYLFGVLVMLLPGILLASGKTDYSVAQIDEDLQKNAVAVVRKYDMHVSIGASGKDISVSYTYAITILNERGRMYSRLEEYESTFDKIKNVTAEIFDAQGRSITHLRKSDFHINAMYSGNGFYDDNRSCKYTPEGYAYPFTVVYDVSRKQGHSLFIENFIPQPGSDCAVEDASFEVVTANRFKVRYRQFGYPDNYPEVIEKSGKKKYNWQCGPVYAHEKEPLEYILYRKGSVVLEPQNFDIKSYSGKMDTWEALSSFVYKLNIDKEGVPDAVADQVKKITANEADTIKKIQAVYSYLQDNTRYVAIESGINGWKTMSPKYTAENKFGDCKALSYYMQALLKEAGIASDAVLVNAGRNNKGKIMKDFPSAGFNHVILRVPLAKDTVWLECTSSDLPAGFLSDFTQNRDVLILSEQDGYLAHTPRYDSAFNKIYRTVQGKLNNDGAMKLNVRNDYYGEQASMLLERTRDKSYKELEQYLSNKFRLRSYRVNDFSYVTNKSYGQMNLNEQVTMVANSMMNKTAEYFFLNYDLLPLYVPEYFDTKKRIAPFHISSTIQVADSFDITLPEGYTVASLPREIISVKQFGYYCRSITRDGGIIKVSRKFVHNQGVYQPELFSEYVEWLDMIGKDSKKQVVLSAK